MVVNVSFCFINVEMSLVPALIVIKSEKLTIFDSQMSGVFRFLRLKSSTKRVARWAEAMYSFSVSS